MWIYKHAKVLTVLILFMLSINNFIIVNSIGVGVHVFLDE